ncbi:hypothetical protein DQ384_13590 [Sphaerisporangium album]|uniref:Uncharacterized protein n=1 Tax=Sphaerisporangium album TaxID=509200 RepID=A0A367FKQ6_9ACTN|nr:hypothetical protein [Sphaerisporangium album]RCG30978.1 hypothetical protein DQ384_13590 [Sphaerisporangium album]
MQATRLRRRLPFTPKTAWGIADQALASATSIALTVVVAREVDIAALGAFAIANTLYMIVLGFSRTVVSEPLLVRFSHVPPDEHRRGVRESTGLALLIGLLGGLLLMAVVPLSGGAVAEAVYPLALFLPGLLLKDAWRFAFIAADRPGQAILNDVIWAAGQVAGVGWVIRSGHPTVGGIVAAWAISATVAAVAGAVQARVLPAPWRAHRWVRATWDLLPAYTVEFVARMGGRNLAMLAIGWAGGLQVLGAIRAAEVVFGPLNVLLQAGGLVAIPQAVGALRRSAATLRTTVVTQSAALVVMAAGYTVVALVLPVGVGRALVGESWGLAESILLPTALLYACVAAMTGPVVGLRALGDTRRSPAVRLMFAPLYIGFSVAGAASYGAVGAATGLALANLAGAALWIWQFHSAVRGAEPPDSSPPLVPTSVSAPVAAPAAKPAPAPPAPASSALPSIRRVTRGDTMELSEYGRRYRGIIVPLAAIPIVAAAGGAGWAYLQPLTYRHVVELQVTTPDAAGGAALAEQSVANYRTLVGSASVTEAAARKTGVDAGSVAGGLTTARPDGVKERGTVVQVVYTGEDPVKAAAVTRAVATAALDALIDPYVQRAKSDVATARRTADDSAKALAKVVRKNGLAPDRYRVLYAEITRLQSELAAPTGTRDKNEILKAISDRQKQLAALTPDLVPFIARQNESDQANRFLVQATQTLRQAEARLAQSRASIRPVTPEGEAVAKSPLVARSAAMAGGVGALLAVVILLLRELLRQRRPVVHLGPPRVSAVQAMPPGQPPQHDVRVIEPEIRVLSGGERTEHRQLG